MNNNGREFLNSLKKIVKKSFESEEFKEQIDVVKEQLSETKNEFNKQFNEVKNELNEKSPFLKSLLGETNDSEIEKEDEKQINDGFSFFKSVDEETTLSENISSDAEQKKNEESKSLKVASIEEYILPDINNLKKSPKISREQYEQAKKYGEDISEMYNSIGMECDFREAEVFDAYTVIRICFKKKRDFEIYKNIVPTLNNKYPGFHLAEDSTSSFDNSIIILLPNNEDGLQIGDILCNESDETKDIKTAFGVGIDFNYKPVFCDLAKCKNLVIGGVFESGKTTLIEQILISLLHKNTPEEMKLVICDTMKTNYIDLVDIPQLLWPIITETNMMSNLLNKLLVMQEDRINVLARCGKRNIESYNNTASDSGVNKMSRVIVVIDKFDLFIQDTDGETINVLSELLLKGPLTGIHFILETSCTQRNVLEGRLKSSIGGRIAFKVPNLSVSNLLIDGSGAEFIDAPREIIYKGGAFGNQQNVIVPELSQRIATTFFKNEKVKAKPRYDDSYFEFLTSFNGRTISQNDSNDSLYDDAVEFVAQVQKASTSILQRRFGIGYNRAARLIDDMEDRGIIGPARGSEPREVYIKKDRLKSKH